MALKKTTTSVHGFVCEDAYHRVEGVRLDGKNKILFQVRTYKEPASASFADRSYDCGYSLDGDNPIKQAYQHLKTLPEFADAQDC